MATVPSPTSALVGQFETAAYFNTQVTAAVNFLLNPPAAKLTQNTAQAVPSGTTTTLVNMAVVDDNDGMLSGNGLVVRTAGLWIIECEVTWAPNATGYRTAGIAINSTDVKRVARDANATSGLDTSVQVVLRMRLSVGDTIQPRGLQTSGAALNTIVTTQESTSLSATRLGS